MVTQNVTRCVPSILQRNKTQVFGDLRVSSRRFCQAIRRCFGLFEYLIPPLSMEIYDLNTQAQLTVKRGLMEGVDQKVHIRAHSSVLEKWWSKAYGTDSLVVGAHFELVGDSRPLQRWILASLLIENRLDLRSLLGMLLHAQGRRFLWNRREEILAIVLGGRLLAGVQR